VANGVVYIGSDNVYALDTANGTVKWTYPTLASVNSSPTVANGVVYFGANDDNLYALNATNGIAKWHYMI
jgi:outer membrane protein assembly factor BamB